MTTSTSRMLLKLGFVMLTSLLLTSCGGGAPTSSRAPQLLNLAKENETAADSHMSAGRDEQALTMYKEALSQVEEGLKVAFPGERPPLLSLKERIAPKITELKQREAQRKIREAEEQKKKEEARKLAELKSKDEKEAKKEAADAAKKAAEKKANEARAEDLKTLSIGTSTKTVAKVDKPDDEEGQPKSGGETKKDQKDQKEAPKPPEGPFNVYDGKEKPRLTVDKVEVRGEFIFAYIQMYNADKKNLRIARPEVTFTSATDTDVCGADACFQYDLFDKGIANPLDQTNQKAFITGGSHEIAAESGFKLVAITQDRSKASRVRKAKVAIQFEDGNSWTAKGPEGAKAAAGAAEGIPGL